MSTVTDVSGKVHLVPISSEIFEDSFENGEGKPTGCGLRGDPVGKLYVEYFNILFHRIRED